MERPETKQAFERFEATTSEDLHRIGSLLHDECFDLDTIRYDQAAGTVEIPFRCIFHEQQPRRLLMSWWWIYRVYEVDALRGLLRFSNVIGYELYDRAGIGCYSFNTIAYDSDERMVTVVCCPVCEIRLQVTGLLAEYAELEYRGKARITNVLLCEDSSGRIYDDEPAEEAGAVHR